MVSFRDYLDNKENLCEGKQAPIFKVSSKNDDVCKALEDIDGFSVRDWDSQPIVATKWFDSDWEIKITVNPDWRTGKLVVSVDLVNDRGRSIRHKDVRNERELLNTVEEYEELEMRMNENVSEALDTNETVAYIDGQMVHLSIVNDRELSEFKYDEQNSVLSLTLEPGSHNVGLLLVDRAGNKKYISEVRHLAIGNNRIWIGAGISIGIFLMAVISVYVVKKAGKSMFT